MAAHSDLLKQVGIIEKKAKKKSIREIEEEVENIKK